MNLLAKKQYFREFTVKKIKIKNSSHCHHCLWDSGPHERGGGLHCMGNHHPQRSGPLIPVIRRCSIHYSGCVPERRAAGDGGRTGHEKRREMKTETKRNWRKGGRCNDITQIQSNPHIYYFWMLALTSEASKHTCRQNKDAANEEGES